MQTVVGAKSVLERRMQKKLSGHKDTEMATQQKQFEKTEDYVLIYFFIESARKKLVPNI